MKSFVINLKSSPERRAACQQELEKHGMEYEFFDAWTGAQVIEKNLFPINEAKFRIRTNSKPSGGQIGCFASHYLLWKHCVEINQPIIIFEDDFAFTDNIKDVLATTSKNIQQYGFVRLNSNKKKGVLIKSENGLEIRRLLKPPMLAAAYALSPGAANKLCKHFDEFIEPLDFYLKRFWVFGQRVYQIYPESVVLNEHSEVTTIDADTRIPKTLNTAIRRFGDQLFHSGARKLFNLTFLLRNLVLPNNKV